MRWLTRRTIWAQDALPLDDAEMRQYRRLWLPIVDVLFVLGGWAVADTPAPAITELLSRTSGYFGIALALAGLITLLGAVFPRLWVVEVIGKSGILFLLAALASASFLSGRPFGAVLAALAAIPVLFRLSILGAERRQRKENAPGGL